MVAVLKYYFYQNQNEQSLHGAKCNYELRKHIFNVWVVDVILTFNL